MGSDGEISRLNNVCSHSSLAIHIILYIRPRHDKLNHGNEEISIHGQIRTARLTTLILSQEELFENSALIEVLHLHRRMARHPW